MKLLRNNKFSFLKIKPRFGVVFLFHPYFVVILKRDQAKKEINQNEDKNI
jgi:hypothetical protein